MATYYVILEDKAFRTAEIQGTHSCRSIAEGQAEGFESVEHYRPAVITATEYKERERKGWQFYA